MYTSLVFFFSSADILLRSGSKDCLILLIWGGRFGTTDSPLPWVKFFIAACITASLSWMFTNLTNIFGVEVAARVPSWSPGSDIGFTGKRWTAANIIRRLSRFRSCERKLRSLSSVTFGDSPIVPSIPLITRCHFRPETSKAGRLFFFFLNLILNVN